MTEAPKKAFGSPAADQVLHVLDYLSTQRGPIPASAIARALHLPRSTTYQLLRVMEHRGFVVHIPARSRYGLGVRAFELGSGYARQQPLVLLGEPLVRRLVADTGHSGHLAVLHGTDVIYLVEERGHKGPRLISDVGVRLPAHLTATGRALLAALPPAQLRALYPDATTPLATRHGVGPKTLRELKTLLSTTRQRGCATEHGEVTEGLASVAVAVTDRTGWPVAALAITAPEGDITDSGSSTLAATVSEAAADLSRRLA
jgi:DNA-binding IclR family transcriptional regulator